MPKPCFPEYAPFGRTIVLSLVLSFSFTSGLMGQTLFTDSAYLYPGVEPCADDYSKVWHCYNVEAPPSPSLHRSLVTPSVSYAALGSLSSWEVPLDSQIDPATPGDRFVLPSRSSASDDGRLLVAGKKPPDDHPYSQITSRTLPSVVLFRPETLGQDLKVGSQPALDDAAFGLLHPVMIHNPWLSNMATHYDLDAPGLSGPSTFHMDLCEDADKEPRYCKAQLVETSGGAWIEGDCYDETVLVSLEQGDLKKVELRSVPLTVFLPEAKSATNSDIYLYPRVSGSVLPPLSMIESLDQVGVGKSWNEVLTACEASPPEQPFYCQYVHSQSYLENFQVHKKADWETDPYVLQAGGVNSSYYFTLLEPVTTSDGRLLVLNGGSALYYAFNENRCEAAGFDRFEPVSKMPIDPDIYNNYDIGRSQRRNGQALAFRDSLGSPIVPGPA